MLLKTFRFNKRYFGYEFKRFFPYTMIMTLILLAVNVITYSFATSYSVGESLYLIEISYPTQVFMYIIPIILGCLHFKFLFSRNNSDFYGAMPITRAELFNSNALSGLASIFIVIGVNALYLAVTMPLIHPGVMIDPSIFVWYFLYWFVAYGVMFAVTAFAATVSGTVLAQLVLSFVVSITPGFFISAFQHIVCNGCTYVRTVSQYVDLTSADMLIKVLFAPYYPIQQLFFSFMGHAKFTGMFYDIQTWPMLIINLIAMLLLFYGGTRLLRRRKFEVAGGVYVSEKLYSVVKILVIFPFAFFMWNILADSTELWIFLFFIVIITVFYLLMDICLRKGLAKVKRSAVTYLLSLAFSFAVFMGIHGIMAIINSNRIYVPAADVGSITVYMAPAGLDYAESIVPNQKAMVKFTYDDPELSSAFKSYDTYEKEGSTPMTLRVEIDGHSIFGRYYVSNRFMTRLYELMDADEELWDDIDYTDKRNKSSVMTTVRTNTVYTQYEDSYIGGYYYSGYNKFVINNKEAARGMLSMLDRFNEDLKSSARYHYGINADVPVREDSKPYYKDETSEVMTASFVSYINGVYYSETYTPYTTAEFEEFCSYLDMNAKDYLKTGKAGAVSLGMTASTKFFMNDFLGSSQILHSVCQKYGESIISTVAKSDTVPEVEDTVVVKIYGNSDFVLMPISYKNVLAPFVEKHLADSYNGVSDFDPYMADEITISLYLDGSTEVSFGLGSYFMHSEYTDVFAKILPYFSDAKELYTIDGHLAKNIKGKDIVEIDVYVHGVAKYHFYAYMNDVLQEVFTDESSLLYNFAYDTYVHLKDEEIVTIKMDGEYLTEGYLQYFTPYVIEAILGTAQYDENTVGELYCILTVGETDIKTFEGWLPVDTDMMNVYSSMVKKIPFDELMKAGGV